MFGQQGVGNIEDRGVHDQANVNKSAWLNEVIPGPNLRGLLRRNLDQRMIDVMVAEVPAAQAEARRNELSQLRGEVHNAIAVLQGRNYPF